jgi:ABC-2 type transport system ATP-binding protein
MTNVTSHNDSLHYRGLSFSFILSSETKKRTQKEKDMSQCVVEIENLVKRYGDKVAVDHFSLNVNEGEILGLLGPNGSGKTTTINCLLSLLQYDKGTVTIFDKEMKPEAYDIKSQIGVVMQNVAVIDTLNVYENVDFFCGLYIRDKATRKQYVEEALEFTGLTEYKKYKPKKLSGGLLRRLNIACGIAHKPKLIIFDEPTVAVDPQSRNAILEGIKKMNKDGATIIYTSHYMEEVEELCSRVVIMDHGKNIANGTTSELKSSLMNRETIRVNLPNKTDEIIKGLKEINHVYKIKEDGDDLVIKCDGGDHNLVHVLSYLTDNNIPFGHVSTELPTLNDVFLEITGKELRD